MNPNLHKSLGLDQLESNLAKLPEKAYLKNKWHCSGPHGEPPVICVVKGEEGFYPIYTDATAEDLNASLGVTPQQASAMGYGSMFGWGCGGADVDNKCNAKGPI